MTRIENPSLSQKLNLYANKNSQTNFFLQVQTEIANDGMTEKTLEEIADISIHGLSLGKIIQLNIDEGNLNNQDGIITPNRKEKKDEC